MSRPVLRLALAALVLWSPVVPLAQRATPRDWPVYGHDAGGTRFSPLTALTRDNVARLELR